jgi:hypothetical protein
MDPQEMADARQIGEQLGAITDATQILLRQATRPHRQLPTPTFDGNRDVEDFLRDFYQVAGLNGWGTDELPIRLRGALSGSAQTGLDGCRNDGEIVARLRARYQLSEAGASQLLKNIKWNAGEDVFQFTDHLQKLMPRAFPELDAGQIQQRILKELLQALPPRLKHITWELQQRPIHDLSEVVALIHQFEVTNPTGPPVRTVQEKEVETLRQQLQQQAEQLHAQAEVLRKITETQQLMQQQYQLPRPRTSNPPERRSRAEIECYGCGQKGHIKRQCPKTAGN